MSRRNSAGPVEPEPPRPQGPASSAPDRWNGNATPRRKKDAAGSRRQSQTRCPYCPRSVQPQSVRVSECRGPWPHSGFPAPCGPFSKTGGSGRPAWPGCALASPPVWSGDQAGPTGYCRSRPGQRNTPSAFLPPKHCGQNWVRSARRSGPGGRYCGIRTPCTVSISTVAPPASTSSVAAPSPRTSVTMA